MNFKGITVNLEFEGEMYSRSLNEDSKIDESNLDYEFKTQAEKFGWWASVCELSQHRLRVLKNDLDMLEGRIAYNFRNAANAAKMKITENMVLEEIKNNKDHQALLLDMLECQKQAGLLKAGRDSLLQKKDMLISLGANFRAEGQANPIILKEEAKRKAREMAARQQEYRENQEDKPNSESKVIKIGKKQIRKGE